MFKKIVIVVAILLCIAGVAQAAYFWDEHSIVGGLSGTDGIPMKVDSDGSPNVSLNPGTSILSGQTNVTTAGTEVPLTTTTAILSVTVKAKVGNTGYIYVGPNGVSSTTGFVLSKGESITYDTDNLADVYIDCSVNGEGVSYTALVK